MKANTGMSYIPLHVHTEYSLLDGMSTVKELFERANELRMPAIAITDHGTMAGVKDFFNHAKRFYPDIKPILGNEIYFAGCPNHNQKEGERKRYYHLILLAKNLQGYNNLCKISSTAAAGDIYKGRAIVDYDTLVANHEGLICMSACIGGEIPQYILKDDMKGAEMTLKQYREIFGDDFFLEVSLHPTKREGDSNEIELLQRKANETLFKLGKKFNIPVVATNDSHFTYKHQAAAHDEMLAINCGKKVSDKNRLHYTGEEYLKSGQEMLELFPQHPEAVFNTQLVADKIKRYDIDASPEC